MSKATRRVNVEQRVILSDLFILRHPSSLPIVKIVGSFAGILRFVGFGSSVVRAFCHLPDELIPTANQCVETD